MSRIVYSLFLYTLVPLLLMRLLWRARWAPAYRRRWRERFGFMPPLPGGRDVIWVHAVSVGETLAAIPLIRRLQGEYPQALVAVTTMTPTGSERVTAAFGDAVYHVYAPYDLPDAVDRFLRRLRPRLLIIMETELWPNTLAACRRRGIPAVLANARMSAKSAAGYRRVAWLSRPMLAGLPAVAVQTRADGERLEALGARREAISITGNIKFDLEIGDSERTRAAALADQWRGEGHRPVLLAASTHRGEEPRVLAAFAGIREQIPDLLLVLVPRHPERFDEVADLCRQAGFEPVRRSSGRVPSARDAVVLGDTMGELSVFFGACDLAFVGGSLVPVGGHNMIEAAAWGVPVVTGPALFNFSEASSLLRAAGAMKVVGDDRELADAVLAWLRQPDECRAAGAAGRRVAENNRGAMTRLLAVIARQWPVR